MSILKTTIAALAAACILAAALPATHADSPVTGVVVAESHDNFVSTYTLQPTLGAAAPTGQTGAGRGSTFQFFEEKALLAKYNARTGNQLSYWGCGSGCGQAGVLNTATTVSPSPVCSAPDANRFAGDVASCPLETSQWMLFAGSDAPLSAAQYATSASLSGGNDKNMLTFPIAVGVVGMAYNYPACNVLTLTPAQISGVISGTITTWAGLQTSTDNACINGDTSPITPFVRCDKSGTTFAFTDFLTQSGSGWSHGAAQTPIKTFYPADGCGTGNVGVAQGVQHKAGSIGYVELDQINALGLQAASVYNKAGVPTAPSVAGAQAAENAKNPTLPTSEQHWTGVSLVWADGVQSYPITTFTYIFAPANPGLYAGYPYTPDQFNAVRGFINYVVTDGQTSLPNGLAPLTSGQQANALRGLSLMSWMDGPTVTLTQGSQTHPIAANGYPALGAAGTVSSGVFTPSASNYGAFLGTSADLAQGHEGQYVSYTGTVIVAGNVLVTDSGVIGIVSPDAGIASGVYSTVNAQVVNGVAVAQSVA